LIRFVSHERIQGNPTVKRRGFRNEKAAGQEKPNGPARASTGPAAEYGYEHTEIVEWISLT
jgi:hypothetical protein